MTRAGVLIDHWSESVHDSRAFRVRVDKEPRETLHRPAFSLLLGTSQIAMPDSETPNSNPERDNGAAQHSAAESAVGASPEQPAQGSAPPPVSHSTPTAALRPSPATPMPSTPPVTFSTPPAASADTAASGDTPEPVEHAVRGRRGVWAAVAVLCVLAGIVGSILGARAEAHNDAAGARRAFQQTSTSIASTLRVAIRHEEQLTVSAGTFFASHPKATRAEFATWVEWARTQRRYPELDALGLLTPADSSPALLLSRDTGLSIYTPVPSAGGTALALETPVYRGFVTPLSVFGRRAASVGWLREVLIPGVVLHEALAGQPGYALRLRYRAGSANVVFVSGAAQAGAQSTAMSFHNGWTVKTFGPAAGGGVFADGNALALLIGGSLLSLLLGVLVFLLGSGLARSPAPAPKTGDTPHEDLYDALTGLPNRALMLDRAERMLARAGRQSEIVAGALSSKSTGSRTSTTSSGRPPAISC